MVVPSQPRLDLGRDHRAQSIVAGDDHADIIAGLRGFHPSSQVDQEYQGNHSAHLVSPPSGVMSISHQGVARLAIRSVVEPAITKGPASDTVSGKCNDAVPLVSVSAGLW